MPPASSEKGPQSPSRQRPGRQRLAPCCLALAFAGSLAPLLVGCDQMTASGTPDYSTTARENYERAVGETKKQNYADAIKYFEYVKKKFSFSKYATLSELGIADANYGREKYLDAIDGYRAFIKNHPTHEKTTDGYAEYRVGASYYKEIPSEWFLVPPAYEKDMGPVRDALRELAMFVVEYRDSPYLPEARKLEEDCVRRLADHEIYVSDFYMKRKKSAAAIGRLEGLIRGDFLPKLASETGNATDRLSDVARTYLREHLEPDVLLRLGQAFMGTERNDDARGAFTRLVEQHPSDYHAKKATLFLARIGPGPLGNAGLPPLPPPVDKGAAEPAPTKPAPNERPKSATDTEAKPAE